MIKKKEKVIFVAVSANRMSKIFSMGTNFYNNEKRPVGQRLVVTLILCDRRSEQKL